MYISVVANLTSIVHRVVHIFKCFAGSGPNLWIIFSSFSSQPTDIDKSVYEE